MNQQEEDDALRAAKGIGCGLVLGILLWAVIGFAFCAAW